MSSNFIKTKSKFIIPSLIAILIIGITSAAIVLNNSAEVIVGKAFNRFLTLKNPALDINYHQKDNSLDLTANFATKTDEKSAKSGLEGTVTINDNFTGLKGDLQIGGLNQEDRVYYRVTGLKDLENPSRNVQTALSDLDIETGSWWTQFDAASLSNFAKILDENANPDCSQTLFSLLKRQPKPETKPSDFQKILKDLPFTVQNELGRGDDGLLVYEIAADPAELKTFITKIAGLYEDGDAAEKCLAPSETPLVFDIYVRNGLFNKILQKIVLETDRYSLTISELTPRDFELEDFNTMTTLSRNNSIYPRLLPKLKEALAENIVSRPEYTEKIAAEANDTDSSACNSAENVKNNLKKEIQQKLDERLQIGALLRYE
jgi:hypothetical protein